MQVLLPFVAGWLAIRALEPFFLTANGVRFIELVVWLVQAIFIASVVSAAIYRVVQVFTPLVSLLNMTLVFPDSVPSRFGLALRSSNVKHLLAEPSIRLDSSAQVAAEQAVQLVTQLAKHEPLTRGHTERVRAYADVIGQQMGLSEEDLNGLRWGALLHDVGKLTVPAEILNKPGKPTNEEWAILRGHPGAAVEILAPLEDWLGEWLLAAPQHHERWDGGGYPAGLSGLDISLAGRITAVADAYDVITSRRSYKAPQSAEDARAEMVRSAGSHFDPVVVRALLEAGITQSARGKRLGWVLELPGLTQLVTSVGKIGAAAAAAVVLSVAPFIAAESTSEGNETEDAPAALAFAASTTDDEEPVYTTTTLLSSGSSDPVAVDTVDDLITTTSTTAVAALAESTTSTVPRDPAAPSITSTSSSSQVPAPTSTQPSTTIARTTVGPSTTTSTTTTTTTTSTVAPPSADCALLQGGQTYLPGGDLQGCDLSFMSIDGLDVSGGNLDGVNLLGATLTNFNLNGASLDAALLDQAAFTRGSMIDSSLVGVSAEGFVAVEVNFYQADARGADFDKAQFRDASFGLADLQNAMFREAIFVGTNFNDATLISAIMTNTNLEATEFYRAQIGQLQLGGADLTGAIFLDAVGTPVGTPTATFLITKCPDGIVLNTDCWAVR